MLNRCSTLALAQMAEALSSSALAGMVASFPQIQFPSAITGFHPFTTTTLPSSMQLVPATLSSGRLPLPSQPVDTAFLRLRLWLPWRPVSRFNRSGCPVFRRARKTEAKSVGMEIHSPGDAECMSSRLRSNAPSSRVTTSQSRTLVTVIIIHSYCRCCRRCHPACKRISELRSQRASHTVSHPQ